VHSLRENQLTGLVRKIIGTSTSVSPPSTLHTLHTHALPAKMAVAAHRLHLDTLPTLPSHSDRACTMGQHSIVLSISCGKSRPQGPNAMVCYGGDGCSPAVGWGAISQNRVAPKYILPVASCMCTWTQPMLLIGRQQSGRIFNLILWMMLI